MVLLSGIPLFSGLTANGGILYNTGKEEEPLSILSYLTVIGMAMLPIVELKGAIPTGLALGMPPWTAFWMAFIGSSIVCPIIIFLFRPVVAWIRRHNIPVLRKVADWAQERGYRKSASIRKYSLLGLFIFVAIPIPTTGVWMGSLIATLLDLRELHAVPVIVLGNLVAGLIVFLVSGQFLIN